MEPQQPYLPWNRPGFLERAEAWLDLQIDRLGLEPLGPLELFRAKPWAAVARLEIAGGTIWLKQPAPALAFEVPLTRLMADAFPADAPIVLAAEGEWLLTADAGPALGALREQSEEIPAWDGILGRYAEIQIELLGRVDELLALGTPDKRPRTLLASYQEIVSRSSLASVEKSELLALAPELERACQRLEQAALPNGLGHEEVHNGNIFLKDGQVRLLDWGEASVAHPLSGAMNALRSIRWQEGLEPGGDELLRLRDAYLEPWGGLASLAELRELFADACLFGCLCRALTWEQIVLPLSPAEQWEFNEHADSSAAWLRILCDALAGSLLGT